MKPLRLVIAALAPSPAAERRPDPPHLGSVEFKATPDRPLGWRRLDGRFPGATPRRPGAAASGITTVLRYRRRARGRVARQG